MTTPNRAIVFDVNAYVYLSQSDGPGVADVVAAEEASGFKAYLNPIVAMEQLAAAASLVQLEGTGVLASIRTMRTHASESADQGIRMLLDPEANICKALFDTLPKDAEKTLGTFEALVRTLSDAADPDAIVVTERAQ